MAPLCAPKEGLSCFGCCPPIRPSHYDPLDYVTSLRREFGDQRQEFLRSELRHRPIIGYYCWALGFLDPAGRTVGCLLHPSQNRGQDLRDLIDYGNKCRRENCRAARVFDELPPEGQGFWLSLVEGLNAFYYSSRRANPLFHLLLWGTHLLEKLRWHGEREGCCATELLYAFPFLVDRRWKPQAHRYLFHLMLERFGEHPDFPEILEGVSIQLLERVAGLEEVDNLRQGCREGEGTLTHLAKLSSDFLDFVRLGLGVARVSDVRLREAKESIERLCAETGSVRKGFAGAVERQERGCSGDNGTGFDQEKRNHD